jgi:hypothetical protein
MKGKTYAVFHYDFHLKNRKMEIFMAWKKLKNTSFHLSWVGRERLYYGDFIPGACRFSTKGRKNAFNDDLLMKFSSVGILFIWSNLFPRKWGWNFFELFKLSVNFIEVFSHVKNSFNKKLIKNFPRHYFPPFDKQQNFKLDIIKRLAYN